VALMDNVSRMKTGDPADPHTFLAERQRQRVSEYIQSGLESGAKLATGGLGMPEGINHGAFVKPTVSRMSTTARASRRRRSSARSSASSLMMGRRE
jgi:acyl-CoA reductase-like NAD-dependent aldehyde dehydrogenase